ncbi:MAG: DUF4019 domain-containing protein [Burkholderiales bacterium]|nr:MAG: DUF4019 domain-containing protein [Burkholderiales bacterium]
MNRTMRKTRLPTYAVVVLLPALGATSAQDRTQVEDHGGGRYTLTTTLTATTDPMHGQLAIVPKAEALCGDLHPHYGHYRFESTAPAPPAAPAQATAELRYSQDIQCLETAEQALQETAGTVPPAPATPPTAADEALIQRRTTEYLLAKVAVDANAAYAMLSETMRSYAAPEDWRATRNAFNAKAGAGAVPAVVRLSWYDNPANAPTPGRYVAADYRVDYPSGAFSCGYVAWLLHGDGNYLVVREEEGQMTPDLLATLAPEQRSTIRAQLQCRD